jgi:mono/diheme cytochrome c family protein
MNLSYRSTPLLPTGVSRRSLGLLTLALLVLLLASACSISLAEDVTPPPGYRAPVVATQPAASAASLALPDRPLDPAAGAPLYTEKCAPCHGDSGLGDGSQAAQLPNPATPIGDRAIASQSTPLDWFSVITNGRLDRFMPPFINGLSDQERWDVLAYVYTLSVPQDALAAGDALYQANCVECHGSAGDGAGAASAAENLPDFSDPAVMAARSTADLYGAITAGFAPSMPAYADQFDEESRWSLAFFLRTLAYRSSTQAVAADPEAADVGSPEAAASPGPSNQENPQDTVPDGPALVTGTITGLVNNGSGGGIPEALLITLHGFDHIEEVYTTTTTTAPDGSFLFEDVEMLPSRIYLVTADYNQTIYNSDLGIVEPETEAMNLPITIFETTTDKTLLVVDRLHMFVESVTPGLLQVTELYLISNPSDRVVVAPEEGEPVVAYSIPPEAVNLRFQDGSADGRYIPTAEGFGDTAGVPPGTSQHQVMFAYDLPYERKLDLSKPHALPVNAVILLMPDMGIQIKSDQLDDTGPRDIQGEIFQVYTGDRIEADQPLVLSLSGSITGNEPSVIGTGSQTSLVIGLVAFGITLVFSGIWLFRRNRTMWNEEPDMEPEIAGNGTVEHLADAIIALDDLYASGDLPEEAYRQRRAELKAELKEKLSTDRP